MDNNTNQGNDQWFSDRCGLITASNFKKVLAKPQSETYKTYIADLVAERLTGLKEAVTAESLEWGKENEAKALSVYEFMRSEKDELQQVGFIQHPKYPFCGASPDFLVGDIGGGEIKCPKNTSIHVKTLNNREMPAEHKPQVQGALWVTGRQWWDFISYDPRLHAGAYFCQRVERDEPYIEKLEKAVIETEQRILEALDRILEAA